MSNNLTQKTFRFRRYCRAAYAAFRSLHCKVTIGHVATYIADRQLRKSACTVALCLPLLMTGEAMAQSDDDLEGLTLPVVSITASSDTASATEGASAVLTQQDFQNITATTVGQMLEALPAVDIRTRGVGDMQGDITLRGGTFDQVVVLLDGINISDPQTGHHNLDLPIDLSMVERIELLSPSALMRYGVSSFCGGINIVTSQSHADHMRARLSAGSHGTASLAVGGDRHIGQWNLSATGAYNRSDGYRHNTDYRNANIFLHATKRDSLGAWHIQLGGQAKDFGSQAFYSLKYPDQYEATRTITAAVQRQQHIGTWSADMAIYCRLHSDRFELFREGFAQPPAWYGGHNYHLASTSGVRLRASKFNINKIGRITLGVEYRREGIISNVLGDSLSKPHKVLFETDDHYYTLGCVRHRGSAFAQQSLYLGDWELSAAAHLHATSTMPAGYGYALSALWHASPWTTITASVGRSDRQPTFTDLYYHSATQIANPLLHTETSHIAELSAEFRRKCWLTSANIYLRRGTDIIDWIRQPDESVWHSMNHSRIDALGADLRAGYRGSPTSLVFGLLDVRTAEIAYSFCTMNQATNGYVSQYALDYLRHKISATLAVSPMTNLTIKTNVAYHYRIGGYTDINGILYRYTPVLNINAAAEYRWKQTTIFAEACNLLNRTYYDYGGIPLPGTTVMAGLRYGM